MLLKAKIIPKMKNKSPKLDSKANLLKIIDHGLVAEIKEPKRLKLCEKPSSINRKNIETVMNIPKITEGILTAKLFKPRNLIEGRREYA